MLFCTCLTHGKLCLASYPSFKMTPLFSLSPQRELSEPYTTEQRRLWGVQTRALFNKVVECCELGNSANETLLLRVITFAGPWKQSQKDESADFLTCWLSERRGCSCLLTFMLLLLTVFRSTYSSRALNKCFACAQVNTTKFSKGNKISFKNVCIYVCIFFAGRVMEFIKLYNIFSSHLLPL